MTGNGLRPAPEQMPAGCSGVKKVEGCRLKAITSGKMCHLRQFKDYCLRVS
jgi:hypothetical protein